MGVRLLVFWALLTLAAHAQVGTISAVEPSQIGVFRVSLGAGAELSPGDIVRVERGGKALGEATVMKVSSGSAVISLRGVYDASVGDSVVFVRRPQKPGVASSSGTVHESAEYKRAKRLVPQVLAQYPRSSDSAGQARVEAIGRKVAAASGRNIPWNFTLVRDEMPNAFTIGEGWVFVTDGLLALKLTDDELAGVLAHEISHGTERHNMRGEDQMRQIELAEKELEEAKQMAARYEAEYRKEAAMGDPNAEYRYQTRIVTARRRVDKALQRLKSVSYQLEHAKEYSHSDEIDADIKGMEMAVRAGYSAEGLMTALGKLEKFGVDTFGTVAVQGTQSHPATSRRLEILKKVYSSWRSR